MRNLSLILTVLCSLNIFSQEVEKSYETYIPLDFVVKDSIYWSIKSVAMAGTLGINIVNYSVPYLDLDNKFRKDVYGYHSNYCHQFKTRSFCVHTSHGDDYHPLCSRCMGLHTGYFLGTFDSFIWDSFQIKGWERWHQGLLHIGTYSFLILPLVVDGLVQFKTSYTSNNGTRFTTGLFAGYAITAIIDECVQLLLDYDFKKSIEVRKEKKKFRS